MSRVVVGGRNSGPVRELNEIDLDSSGPVNTVVVETHRPSRRRLRLAPAPTDVPEEFLVVTSTVVVVVPVAVTDLGTTVAVTDTDDGKSEV